MYTGTLFTTAIHIRLFSRFFPREGGRLYTGYYLLRNRFLGNLTDKNNRCYEVSPHSDICPCCTREFDRKCTDNFLHTTRGKSVLLSFSVIH